MRLILSLLLLTTLAGCTTADVSQIAPEQSEAEATEPSQTMESTEKESSETMESDEGTSSASPAPSSSATASPKQTAIPTQTASPTPTASPTQTATSYTLAEVAKRNTQTECWVAIDGGVYDLTEWISQHPGGSGAIRSLCGTDGTNQFVSKHGGQSRPSATLDRYYLGPLAG